MRADSGSAKITAIGLPTTYPGNDNDIWLSGGLLRQGDFSGTVAGNWITPTLAGGLTGWAQSSTNPIRYRLSDDGGSVVFEGWMERATGVSTIAEDTTIFTVNTGYRPSRTQPVPTYEVKQDPSESEVHENGSAYVDTSGNVKIWNSNTNIKLWWVSGMIPINSD
ncbi:MAG: hypothetical protein AAF485_03590, partial [Chloroflexota bacterium]